MSFWECSGLVYYFLCSKVYELMITISLVVSIAVTRHDPFCGSALAVARVLLVRIPTAKSAQAWMYISSYPALMGYDLPMDLPNSEGWESNLGWPYLRDLMREQQVMWFLR